MKLVADHSSADTPERTDYPILTASASEGTVNTDPAWYTPARLLIAFCVVSFLVFLDRGIIASNGVNGDKESNTGIQVDSSPVASWLCSHFAAAAALCHNNLMP
jgi:hypothetical protein